MRGRLFVIVLIASLLSSGCQYAAKIGTFHVKQPVMLGKTQNIGGTIIVPSNKKNKIDVSHYHGHAGWGVIGASGAIEYDIRDSRDETEELKKIISASDDLIKIDTVYFTTSFVIFPITLVLYMDFRVTTGAQGNVYENNRGKESEKIKLE